LLSAGLPPAGYRPPMRRSRGARVGEGRPPEQETSMHVVTLRALGLGDLLTALPALRALRRAHPDAHHVLLAPRTLSPLVEWLDLADEVADLDHRTRPPDARLAGLVALRPAVAVNLHGCGPASHR